MKPPMPYSGGKQSLAQTIADLFPAHDHYVEPFGGALSVLLAKTPSKIETVNDINGDLMTFWRVLRDQPDELERLCALTPHSRYEQLEARDLSVELSDLERARRVWVQLTQNRGARLGVKTGWRFVHGTNRMSLARYLDGYLKRIAPAAERLKGVSLENRDALELIAIHGRPGALMYVDPPYMAATRYGEQYADEFGTSDQHAALIDAPSTTCAAVVLSGYDHPLYRDSLTGWKSYRFGATNMRGGKRTEVVWTNYDAPNTLFGDTA